MCIRDRDNPYLTYVNDYDATDVEIFKAIFDNGAIYRGRKPVHWCTHCHTALAEAEIEYGDEVSPSIYVRFVLTSTPAAVSYTHLDVYKRQVFKFAQSWDRFGLRAGAGCAAPCLPAPRQRVPFLRKNEHVPNLRAGN